MATFMLLTDETNNTPSDAAKFFVYGGLIIDVGRLAGLHERIAAIRAELGYQAGDLLKFDTNARPKHITVEQATAAKKAVIESCLDFRCVFVAYVVLHAIAAKQNPADVVAWGANQVIGKFNYFLHVNDGHGLVAIDRLPAGNDYSYLSEKFCHGLKFPDDDPVRLDRILALSSTCANASHANSAMDIVLGSFRYCINDPKNTEAAKTMMANVSRMVWCTRDGEHIRALERGLIFRPKNVKRAPYKAEYDSLLANINELIKDATF